VCPDKAYSFVRGGRKAAGLICKLKMAELPKDSLREVRPFFEIVSLGGKTGVDIMMVSRWERSVWFTLSFLRPALKALADG
jgi:hypothetical protein